MKHSRDLWDIENIGEFAFVMCVVGVVLAIIAYAAAFFFSHWIGITQRSYLVMLAVAFWISLNVPVYRSLSRKARRWGGERRASKQVGYIEVCGAVMLAALSFMASETTGADELLIFLRYFISSWILSLLGYQLLLHLLLGYRIIKHDAVRWCLVGGFAIYSLYGGNS